MKTAVEYKSGESTAHPGEPCDYMLCETMNRHGNSIVLYAELPPVEGDETATYDALKEQIVDQAKSADIDTSTLKFCFD